MKLCFFLEALGKNTFPSVFQLLELPTFLTSGPPSVSKTLSYITLIPPVAITPPPLSLTLLHFSFTIRALVISLNPLFHPGQSPYHKSLTFLKYLFIYFRERE